jgi:GTP-binding protein HflX
MTQLTLLNLDGNSISDLSPLRNMTRMTELRLKLDELEKQRNIRRRSRERNDIPVVALVGYTNAGKSTLLNALTGSDVYVQDQLFATLDAVSRRMETAEKTPYLLTDTVGFITNLPTDLVEAFQSTLEEAALADLLLIVTDASNPDSLAQRRVVDEVLEKLGATVQPRLEVLNKTDKALPEIVLAFPDAVQVCALTGEGMDALEQAIQDKLRDRLVTATLLIPYDKMKASGMVRAYAQDVSESYEDACLRAEAVFTEEQFQRFARAVQDVWRLDDTNCLIHETKGNDPC